ncbi:gustatory and pheromone receptor 33a-like isoform X2 [Uranotaenia lowii]|uniref:gustatory and pheromone receptor 33a-like isoform X2 n=1 Tax=Uranotaenia lowii TaxID=190385 RepID=UPI00247A0EAD|nr:gustatory and pheromone receptor 33a-like isoform X2 [Uranotaenia lowii]
MGHKERLKCRANYVTEKKTAVVALVAAIGGSSTIVLMYYWGQWDIVDTVYLVGTSCLPWFYTGLLAQASMFVLILSHRFRNLSVVLRMYFPTTPSSGGFLTTQTETAVCTEKEQLAVLKQIKILHDKLNDVVELVNYCFSVQITFCVGLCFVIGVVCSFGLFRAFIYRNELFYMGVLNFIWYMYYLFFVLFFIAVGSKITREGKRIGVLVHKAINCSTSSAVINELNIFSQQLLHRSPVITCGLFVYDWTLLYTMIGATATYLIILIQFDVSFPNLVNVNGTAAVTQGGS